MRSRAMAGPTVCSRGRARTSLSRRLDVVNGQRGPDFLAGNTGDDVLIGEFGRDALVGDDGTDACYGGRGIDQAGECEKTAGIP